MVKSYLLTLAIFLGIDFVWLGVIAKIFYDKHLGDFARTTNWPAIVLVYLLIPLGLVFFVYPKIDGNFKSALFWGAFYGLIVYGVYDLTNLATLKNWSVTMVIVDMLWGMTVCGLTSLIATLLLGKK
ncbi:DUF2177 family protein [Patescibacteria group bacterium]|nr:DUF2177 family protein [Patescibacteria group bacterium]